MTTSNKITHIIMSLDEVIGKVFQHPTLGRTVVFESFFKMGDRIIVYESLDGGDWKVVLEKDIIDLFKDIIPPYNVIKG
jgi:hypothetical protein